MLFRSYVGVVFNLDRHDQSGSHWVGLFVNIPKRVISYYDSTASPPPQYIKFFIDMLERNLSKINENKITYQEAGFTQGLFRWTNGDKANDLHNLFNPINIVSPSS